MKRWNEEKGFGFIEPSDGGEDVFVHRTNIGGLQALTEGATVTSARLPREKSQHRYTV